MSGKHFTILFSVACCGLVAYALWYQSTTTREIRRLWTPGGARLIQGAWETTWWPAEATSWNSPSVVGPSVVGIEDAIPSVHPQAAGRDLSGAPGLIHLRATLVDDQYFDWSTRAIHAADDPPPISPDSVRLRWGSPPKSIEMWIAPDSGQVYSPKTRTSVTLIRASQRAIGEYFRQLDVHP